MKLNDFKLVSVCFFINLKTPFEAFEFYYGSELFEKLGYKQVEKNQVIINPKVLKR